MHRDHSQHTGCVYGLLTEDRRADDRRASRAVVWLLDDDLLRAEEFGTTRDLSRGGLCIEVTGDAPRAAHAWPGREWLVLLDEPSGLEPLARQRAALIRLCRIDHGCDGSVRLACAFISRSVRRCLPLPPDVRRAMAHRPGDIVAGDLLDELVDRVYRDVMAAERFGGWRDFRSHLASE